MTHLLFHAADIADRVVRHPRWMRLSRPEAGQPKRFPRTSGVSSFVSRSVEAHISIAPTAFIGSRVRRNAMAATVLLGPAGKILSGDHDASLIGRAISAVREGSPPDDQAVVGEFSMLICPDSTPIKPDIKSGRAIIAAVAAVSRFVAPHSIIGGVPSRLIRRRWDIGASLEDEKALYQPEKRIPQAQLEAAEGRTT